MIQIFIGNEISNFKLYKNDKKRRKKSKGFLASRSLKFRYKLKDKISISHKDDFAVIARAKFRLGVDMERLKERNFEAVMEFCFNEDEKNLVRNSRDKILEFYKIFTFKEAYIKYKNLGFWALKLVNFNEIKDKISIIFIKFDDFLICVVSRKFYERS